MGHRVADWSAATAHAAVGIDNVAHVRGRAVHPPYKIAGLLSKITPDSLIFGEVNLGIPGFTLGPLELLPVPYVHTRRCPHPEHKAYHYRVVVRLTKVEM